jgi:hypothetical protein
MSVARQPKGLVRVENYIGINTPLSMIYSRGEQIYLPSHNTLLSNVMNHVADWWRWKFTRILQVIIASAPQIQMQVVFSQNKINSTTKHVAGGCVQATLASAVPPGPKPTSLDEFNGIILMLNNVGRARHSVRAVRANKKCS